MLSAADLISPAALSRYDSSGEPEYTPSERILLALRWFDWASSSRIFEALDMEAADWTERKTLTKALSRLFAEGRVERRGPVMAFEYRLAVTQPQQREPRAEPAHRTGRAERSSLGLCLRCDSPPAPGRKQCQAHLDANAATVRARRANSQRT